MSSPYLQARSYLGGALGKSGAAGLGRAQAGAGIGAVQELVTARRKRQEQLAKLVQEGKINTSQLGPHDRNLLAAGEVQRFGPKQGGGVSGGRGVLGFLGNLGEDIYNTARYLPAGVKATASALGRSAWADIKDPFNFSDSVLTAKGSREDPFYNEIVKPTLQTYKDVYGPGGGSFFKNLYEHPLGPILDVATVASLGAAGAARAGGVVGRVAQPGSTTARVAGAARSLTSREGRAPLTTATGREIPREYTPRPISKAAQKFAIDPLMGKSDRWQRVAANRAGRRQFREQEQISLAREYDRAAEELDEVNEFANLHPSQAAALTYLQLGINTPQRIQSFQRIVTETSIDDAEKAAVLENLGFDPKLIRAQADLSPDVVQRILEPDDQMIAAHHQWDDYVRKARKESGIDPAVGDEHVAMYQKILDGDENAPQLPRDDFPIAPTYVPMAEASNFRIHRNRFTGKERVVRDPGEREESPKTRESVLRPRDQKYKFKSTGTTFKAGTFRTDARLYMEHVQNRVRDVEDALRKGDIAKRFAKLDEDGKFVRVKNDHEARTLYGPDVTAVPDAYIVQWFRKGQDHMKKVKDVVENHLRETGDEGFDPFDDARMEQLLEEITDKDAQAFSSMNWGAMKRGSIVVDKDFADYLVRMANVHEPFNNPVGRTLSRWYARWKTMTLVYMPRWAINTAVGSFALNSIRGVDLTDYFVAHRLQKAGVLPSGVNLGHQAAIDLMDRQLPGRAKTNIGRHLNDFGVTVPTEKFLKLVQGIENYFRRAAFVHNLKREVRLTRDASGRIVDVGDDGSAQSLVDVGDVLRSHYDRIAGNPDSAKSILEGGAETERALRETNKLAYSYSVLGPTERRIVRQFIPFWGWYKFISMAAYRLPVEMPGRVNVMRFLSDVAAEQEAEMGPIPDWVKGAIPIKLKDGKYKYLSTLGLNPFGSIMNPLSPKGVAQGIGQLGQLNPGIGAVLSAFGVDTLRGGTVPISPFEGVGPGLFGDLRSEETGEPASIAEHAPGRRFAMFLARSFPQYRLSEKYMLDRGRPAFPEHVPYIAPRYMVPSDQVEAEDPTTAILASMFGVYPKTADIAKYQKNLPKIKRYVQTRNKRSRSRLEK